AEDGIRDFHVTGVQTCALPILTVLAAILAIIGYSLNDTIVVFDRIRENFRFLRNTSLIENINISTTQTLLRTLATSISTLLAVRSEERRVGKEGGCREWPWHGR